MNSSFLQSISRLLSSRQTSMQPVMEEEEDTKIEDPVHCLPIEIIVHVVRFFMPNELTKLSLVSKAWYEAVGNLEAQAVKNLLECGELEEHNFALRKRKEIELLKFGYIQNGNLAIYSKDRLYTLQHMKDEPEDEGQFLGVSETGFYAMPSTIISNYKKAICLKRNGTSETLIDSMRFPNFDMYRFPIGEHRFLYISKHGCRCFCANFQTGEIQHLGPWLDINPVLTRQSDINRITVTDAYYREGILILFVYFEGPIFSSIIRFVDAHSNRTLIMESPDPGLVPFSLKEILKTGANKKFFFRYICEFFEASGYIFRHVTRTDSDHNYLECCACIDGKIVPIWKYRMDQPYTVANMGSRLVHIEGKTYFPFFLYTQSEPNGTTLVLLGNNGVEEVEKLRFFIELQGPYEFQKICGDHLVIVNANELHLISLRQPKESSIRHVANLSAVMDCVWHNGELLFLARSLDERKPYSLVKLGNYEVPVTHPFKKKTAKMTSSLEEVDMPHAATYLLTWRIVLFISAGGFFSLLGCTIFCGMAQRVGLAVVSGIGMGAPIPIALLSGSQAIKKRKPFMIQFSP